MLWCWLVDWFIGCYLWFCSTNPPLFCHFISLSLSILDFTKVYEPQSKQKYHKMLIYMNWSFDNTSIRFDSITTNRRMFNIKPKWLFAHIVIYTSIRSQTRNIQSIYIFRLPFIICLILQPFFDDIDYVQCSSFFSHHRLKGFLYGSSDPIPSKWIEFTEWQNQPQNIFEDSLVTTVNNRPTTYWTSIAISKKQKSIHSVLFL